MVKMPRGSDVLATSNSKLIIQVKNKKNKKNNGLIFSSVI